MRRFAFPLLFAAALVLSILIYYDSVNPPQYTRLVLQESPIPHRPPPLPKLVPEIRNHTIIKELLVLPAWHSSLHLVGAPTKNYKDNLLSDKSYVTTWIDAGFTNEFMTYTNLIYLGMVSERVPIVPPFAPFHHMRQSAGILPFGDIFDLEGLRKTISNPVLEWRDVKQLNAPGEHNPSNDENLGCWSCWASGGRPGENEPRQSTYLVEYLGFDVSYTPTPRSTRRRLDKDGAWDPQLFIWSLVELIFPTTKPSVERATFLSRENKHALAPDSHLACFDLLYFISSGKADVEWDEDYSPSWRYVGRHLKFTPRIIKLARGYLANALDVDSPELIPPFITIHIRRGDFGDNCWQAAKPEDCFAPLSAYVKRVKQVQEELRQKYGLVIPDYHVVATSDEEAPSFWEDIAALGWKRIDSKAERIEETHGEWFVPLIDMVIQSMGKGFVGTDHSTVSIVARRRVLDWHRGVVRTVKWGKLGADDE